MINDQLRYSTLYSERTCAAPLLDMFELYSNARARERWNVAFDTTSILYERVDFRVGGIDLFRCGSREGPQYLGQTIYLDIIPPSRIVFSESVSEGERNVCASLNTVTFEQMGESTRVALTMQLASFIGGGLITGIKDAMIAAFDNLEAAAQSRQPAFALRHPN